VTSDQLIVFDMDGVLVEVTESYRDTVIATVKHFAGQQITRDLVQEYKNRGGWNNDWKLTQQILRDLDVEVDYGTVVERFKKIFWGNGTDGLILREKWIAKRGLLERLSDRYGIAIFTGRSREELESTLGRLASHLRFDPIVCTDDIVNGKPAPDGLFKVAERAPGRKLCYIGDTVDDARSATAAGVLFIGVAAKLQPRREELVRIFQAEGAVDILESINQLDSIFGRGSTVSSDL
jgi:HAD superfamily hydrolase (TIGR01548 family)